MKAMLYPYCLESAPLIRHSGLLGNIDLRHVVSPAGWGFAGGDACLADAGPPTRVCVTADFEAALSGSDAVIIGDFRSADSDFIEDLLSKISRAADLGKTVYLLKDFAGLNLPESDLIMRIPKQEAPAACPAEILEIPVPIVLVCGVTDRTSKFELQLSIREELMKKGYAVSQIGSRVYCEIMGFHPYPDFMYGSAWKEEEKILLLNRFVYDICAQENPDVFVLGIPGYAFPFSNKYPGNFGVQLIYAMLALNVDYTILSVFGDSFNEKLLDTAGKMFSERFSVDLDAIHVANCFPDLYKSEKTDKLEISLIDYQKTAEKLTDFAYKKPVFCIHQEGASAFITDNLVDSLADNSFRENVIIGDIL